MYVKKQKAKAPSAFSGRMEVKVIGVKNKDQAGGALLFCLVLYTHTHTHTHTGISVLWSLTRFAGML